MIRLTRSISVSSFDVGATVAVGRERPEFLAVARLAADLGRPIGARDVLRELLGPRPDVLGWRVIERCVDLGLLERVGSRGGEARLSSAGRLALDHGEVLVPEESIWRFFLVNDPLIATALLHVRRLEAEPVKKEREAAKEARSRGESAPQAERSPDLLRNCRGALPRQSVQHGHLLQLIDLGERGAPGPNCTLRLTLSWDVKPLIRLSGRLSREDEDEKAKPIDAEIDAPEVLKQWSRDALWRALVSHAIRVPGPELDRWRAIAGRPVVPHTFQGSQKDALLSFRRNVDVPALELQGLGRFDATSVKDVEIVPASEADAQAWLSWLQWESIDDHLLPAGLERMSRDLLARFPHHRPGPLGPAELLTRARTERGDRTWFLLAPSDLGLWS